MNHPPWQVTAAVLFAFAVLAVLWTVFAAKKDELDAFLDGERKRRQEGDE